MGSWKYEIPDDEIYEASFVGPKKYIMSLQNKTKDGSTRKRRRVIKIRGFNVKQAAAYQKWMQKS